MSVELVGLAVFMAAVTYPSRALPLLVSGIDRLPPVAQEYLRLIAPATLAALAGVYAVVVTDPGAAPALRLGVAPLAVILCVAIVAWRRSLLQGLLGAVLLAALARAAGLA